MLKSLENLQYFLSFIFVQYIPQICWPSATVSSKRLGCCLFLVALLVLLSHESEVVWSFDGDSAVLHQRERKAFALKHCLACLPAMSGFRNRVAITYVPGEDTWNGILYTISIGSSTLVIALHFSLGEGCHCMARAQAIQNSLKEGIQLIKYRHKFLLK